MILQGVCFFGIGKTLSSAFYSLTKATAIGGRKWFGVIIDRSSIILAIVGTT